MVNLFLRTFFLFLIFYSNAEAKLSTDSQSWNILELKTEINKFKFAVQTEVRYSEKSADVFEEHIKPYLGYKTAYGEFGFVYSYLADDNFSIEFEKRYAFQYSKRIFKNYHIDYGIRYRYEFRDFKGQPKIAHRTRLRNQVKFNSLQFYKWIPFANSEFNVYVNDTLAGPGGFSSHRTIAGVSRKFNKVSLTVSYINNYKVKNEDSDMRHALGLGLSFKI